MEFRDVEVMGYPEGVSDLERLIPRIPKKDEEEITKERLEQLVKDYQQVATIDFIKLGKEDRLKVRDEFIERIDAVLKSTARVHETWEKDRNKLESFKKYIMENS